MKKAYGILKLNGGYCDGNSAASGTGLDEWRRYPHTDSSQCCEWDKREGWGVLYLSSIINDYAAELRSEYPATATVSGAFPSIGIDTQGLFNPNLNYKLYMIPALMVMLLTLICGFLPALNIVSEKEVGTIEQINVTPVPKFIFILAKLLPYWLIGFVVLTVCFILAWLIYGIVPVGHFLLIYFFAVLFRSGNVRFPDLLFPTTRQRCNSLCLLCGSVCWL